MKTTFCSIFLLLSLAMTSQNPLSFGNNPVPKNKFQNSFQMVGLTPLNLSFTYGNTKNFASGNALSIYNPMTQMNDNFVRANDRYYESNIKSFSHYGWDGMRVDSLNPYGSSEMGGALLSGLINLLINPKSGF